MSMYDIWLLFHVGLIFIAWSIYMYYVRINFFWEYESIINKQN